MGEIQPREIKENHLIFVRNFIACGDGTASAIAAGFSEANAPGAAWRLLRTPAVVATIQSEVRRELATDAPNSIRVLRWLRDNAESHKVRLDAAKSLAAMAGHVAPRAAAEKPADQPLHEMTTEQLRELAGRLEDEIAGRAKDVSSAIPAPEPTQAIDVIG